MAGRHSAREPLTHRGERCSAAELTDSSQ